jgi:hypothetical protein
LGIFDFFSICFEYDFKANKSAINPPYGMKDKRELDFVLKQLESVEENGLICAIVPCSCLTKSSARDALFSRAAIKKIVICNNDLFYPSAGVKTCIILAEKRAHHLNVQSIILDNFECDGFEIQRGKGRMCVGEGVHDLMEVNITNADETWLRFKIEHVICYADLALKSMEVKYNTQRLKYLSAESQATGGTGPINPVQIASFKISDLFYISKKPRVKYDTSRANLVYEISAKNNNNGIKGVVTCSENTFTGGKIVLVTGGNGGAGMAYYQETDFVISSATAVLEPKDDFSMNAFIGIYVAMELSKYRTKYSRGFPWNMTRIREDTINLPISGNGKIDYDYINALFRLV